MSCWEEKLERIKSMHTSNFIFWILGKFLIGLGIGILLPVYYFGYAWNTVGWMLIFFAIVIQIPAILTVLQKKSQKVKQLKQF